MPITVHAQYPICPTTDERIIPPNAVRGTSVRDVDVTAFTFPDGVRQVRIDTSRVPSATPIVATVRVDFRGSDDVVDTLLTVDALRRHFGRDVEIDLRIPYFPGAQQDRVCAPGEALSCRVFADLINALGCRSVEVWDAHSNVLGAVLDNVRHVTAAQIILSNADVASRFVESNYVVVGPDKGAAARARAVADELGLRYVQAHKERDPDKGRIDRQSIDVPDFCRSGDNYLIVDDICVNGGTFVGLAKLICERMPVPGRICLYVTHCVLPTASAYATLARHVNHVYTANPFHPFGDTFITRLDPCDSVLVQYARPLPPSRGPIMSEAHPLVPSGSQLKAAFEARYGVKYAGFDTEIAAVLEAAIAGVQRGELKTSEAVAAYCLDELNPENSDDVWDVPAAETLKAEYFARYGVEYGETDETLEGIRASIADDVRMNAFDTPEDVFACCLAEMHGDDWPESDPDEEAPEETAAEDDSEDDE